MNLERLIIYLPQLALLGTMFCVVVIGVLSLLPGSDLPAQDFDDKLGHFIAYGALSGLAVLGRHHVPMVGVIVMVIGYGLLLEVLQGIMPFGRTASWLDALANITGTALGCWGAVLVSKYLKRA